MLPEGVKSRTAIELYDDPTDRVTHLARLLEFLLKTISTDISSLTFEQLLTAHATKFTNPRALDYARITRNGIVHGDVRLKKRHILEAETAFDNAIDELSPHLSQALRRAATGLTAENPFVANGHVLEDSPAGFKRANASESANDDIWIRFRAEIIDAVRAEVKQNLESQHDPYDDLTYEEPIALGTIRENLIDGQRYVWIPPGEFLMGAIPEDRLAYPDEKPQHTVVISKGFWVGQSLVTVGAYKQFTKENGLQMPDPPEFDAEWEREDYPIVNATLYDALNYCRWCGGRLLTEAEWEYVCRAGTSTIAPLTHDAWRANSHQRRDRWNAIPVACTPPNAWNVYDMPGNTFEWVKDKYAPDYYPLCGLKRTVDPRGPRIRSGWRSMRGGPLLGGEFFRSSTRWKVGPTAQWDVIGFRCVLVERRYISKLTARTANPGAQHFQSLDEPGELDFPEGSF